MVTFHMNYINKIQNNEVNQIFTNYLECLFMISYLAKYVFSRKNVETRKNHVLRVTAEECESDGDWTIYKGEPLTGIEYNNFPDGRLEAECSYIKGIISGPCREWYPNGQIKLEAEYLNWCKHGLMKKFFESGHLKSCGFYEFDIEIKYEEFNEKGDIIVSREINLESDDYCKLLERRKVHKNSIRN